MSFSSAHHLVMALLVPSLPPSLPSSLSLSHSLTLLPFPGDRSYAGCDECVSAGSVTPRSEGTILTLVDAAAVSVGLVMLKVYGKGTIGRSGY